MTKNYLFIIFWVLNSLLFAKVQVDIPLATEKPIIDGAIEDPAWRKAAKFDTFYQIYPGDNSEPSEKTEAFLTYDEKNIYLMVKCYMENPDQIRAFHCSRDNISNTDRVLVYFDTFNREKGAFLIGCNALGEQVEGKVGNTSINFDFESDGTITDWGYLVEMKLPLSSIKYRNGKDVTWGFYLERRIVDKNEKISASKVDRSTYNYYDNYMLINFDYLASNQHLEVSPAIIGDISGFSESYENDIETDGSISFDNMLEPELNLFYEPNFDLTASMTINPDFSIIEADGVQINVNNTDPIYYSEKRPFFLEKTSNYGSAISVFHTRNFVDPSLGAKVSGASDNLAFLSMLVIDEDVSPERFSLIGEKQDAVLGFSSLTYSKKGSDTFLRGATTYRNFDGKENILGNFDGIIRFTDQIKADYDLAYSIYDKVEYDSLNKEISDDITAGSGYYGSLFFENENIFSRIYTKALTDEFRADLSPEYRPDLGWYADVDAREYYGMFQYEISPSDDSKIYSYLEVGSSTQWQYEYDFEDSDELYRQGEIWIGGVFKNNLNIWTGFEAERELWYDSYYKNHAFWLDIDIDPSEVITLGSAFEIGKNLRYSSDPKINNTLSVRPWINLVPTEHIDMFIQGKYDSMKDSYIARTLEVTSKIQISKKFWVRNIIQGEYYDVFDYGYSSKYLNTYLLVAYIPSAKNALYIGVNSNFGKINEGQNEWKETDVSCFVKISQSFELF